MLRVLILSITILALTGCTPVMVEEVQYNTNEIAYIEFEEYQESVVPKLDKGYAKVKCERIDQRRNISPEDFVARARRYMHVDTVMVDTDISGGLYHFNVCYLRKVDIESMVFGVELNDDMPMYIREQFASNKGCALGKVYYNTPAYKSDLHENDVVVKANGQVITSCSHFQRIIDESDSLRLTIWADGEVFKVDNEILLNKPSMF